MNVLHAPVNVGSQASSLAHAENEARKLTGMSGLSWSANFLPSVIVSDSDRISSVRKFLGSGTAGRIAIQAESLIYGLVNAPRFQTLHLYFGNTMLVSGWRAPRAGQLDLLLWRWLGKTVFATFQGCDARMRSVSAREPVSACREGICDNEDCNSEADLKRRNTIKMFSAWCHKTFCLNPDLQQFVPGSEFLPYVNLDPSLLSVREESASTIPVVVHAPSDRSIKGTAFIERASEELQATHPHELRLVEKMPREEAIRLYAQADVMVDQLHVGWYGGLAVEGMALGLPVISYVNRNHLGGVPKEMREEIPIVSATSANIREVLAKLLENRKRRLEIGKLGRCFVERWHHPLKHARRMLEVYRDPSQSYWDGYRPKE